MSYERRIELIRILVERTQGSVYQGPFKGMKPLPEWSWGDGDVGGKLLGLYESELFDSIEEVINWKPDITLNIGCAEGFYGLGMAYRTGTLSVLFDISESAINISRKNAKANEINNVHFLNDCTVPVYADYLHKAERPFIFMDCEGAEIDILDLNLIPDLAKTAIIVESHDCNRPGITATLIGRFKDTHNIKVISQGPKNPYLDITQDFSDWDKMLLCCEFRPSTMYWLYMMPKT